MSDTCQDIAPLHVFPDLGWFVRFSGEKSLLCIGSKLSASKQFAGNRFVIPGVNKVAHFSIPLQKQSLGGNVSDIKIANQSKWFRELKNTLQSVYGKTPYFEYYDYSLWDIFENLASDTFAELSLKTIGWAHKALQWETEIRFVDSESDNRSYPPISRSYFQPFADRFGFVSNAPVFDLIFSLGPEAGLFLEGRCISKS